MFTCFAFSSRRLWIARRAWVLVCPLLFMAAAGCQPQKNTISQVDPYVGSRPPPIAELPEPVVPAPTPEPVRPPRGPVAGWVPPSGIENRWDCIVVHHS